ncbi:hypothetical protein EI94DRAFT_1799021 [Lactarius quietus]|nr:hypothetical protein EI94DRAFT_1799021 [Lactarius quietus]
MSTILKHAASAARLSARSRVRAFATTSATRKGNISPTLCFFRPTLTPPPSPATYKAPPAAKDAHVGVVKAFSAPSAPSAPTLPDLALSLRHTMQPSRHVRTSLTFHPRMENLPPEQRRTLHS